MVEGGASHMNHAYPMSWGRTPASELRSGTMRSYIRAVEDVSHTFPLPRFQFPPRIRCAMILRSKHPEASLSRMAFRIVTVFIVLLAAVGSVCCQSFNLDKDRLPVV